MMRINVRGQWRQWLDCLLPMILYLAVYELAAALLQTALQVLEDGAGARERVWFAAHAADVSALITALAMAAGFLSIARPARAECAFAPRIHGREDVTAASAAGALALALALNVFFTMSGAASADAGARSAGEQTGSVSLILGILVYGVLSPFVEETVFRGLTYGRLRRLLFAGSPPGWDEKAEDAPARRRGQEMPVRGRAGAGAGHEKEGFPPAAALLSSLLFGIYHGNLIQGIYAFCMGMVFCLFLERTGSLAAAALLHGAINTAVLLLTQSGLYGDLCTPGWLACLLGIAACGGVYTWFQTKRSI